MGRFLLRRLLLAIPTLFGISLITFGMIHLAPGDTVDAGFGGTGNIISNSEAERQRRLYFLDLPLFFNNNPEGLGGRTKRLIADLDNSQGQAEQATKAAVDCGTVCLADFRRAIELNKNRLLQERLRGVIEQIQKARHSNEQIEAGNLAKSVGQLGKDPQAEAKLIGIGSDALPAVMSVLLDSRGDKKRAASRVASALTGTEGVLWGKSSRDDGQVLASWEEWWYQNRRDYMRFSTWERISGRIFETQFAKWLKRIATFSFGYSARDGRAVSEMLGETLPITLLLSFLAMFLAYLIAVPLGIYAAVRKGSIFERISTLIVFVLYSLPS
ncbi:MAG: hypothetical protein V1754_01065, partial [Pseudomonadota bacterium]